MAKQTNWHTLTLVKPRTGYFSHCLRVGKRQATLPVPGDDSRVAVKSYTRTGAVSLARILGLEVV